ncbi:hypothetical protein ACFLVR_04175 [Chloroflexota bacterium]
MGKYIEPEIYNKYKQQILDMSLAVQNYVGIEQRRVESCLTDAEMAAKLGLTAAQVREIRTIAFNDLHPADMWLDSDDQKRMKCQRYFKKR